MNAYTQSLIRKLGEMDISLPGEVRTLLEKDPKDTVGVYLLTEQDQTPNPTRPADLELLAGQAREVALSKTIAADGKWRLDAVYPENLTRYVHLRAAKTGRRVAVLTAREITGFDDPANLLRGSKDSISVYVHKDDPALIPTE